MSLKRHFILKSFCVVMIISTIIKHQYDKANQIGFILSSVYQASLSFDSVAILEYCALLCALISFCFAIQWSNCGCSDFLNNHFHCCSIFWVSLNIEKSALRYWLTP